MPSRRITLSTTALSSSDLVQAIPPDSVPVGLYSSVNIVDDTAFTGGPILKDVLTIEFAPAATVAARRALIDSIGGTVIGGDRTSATTGFYYFRIVPRPTLQRLHSIVARLRGSPLVDESGVVPAVDVPGEYRPAYRWRRMDRARDNHRGAHPDSIPPSPLYFPP
ncbi:MAG: hypothetical protein ABS52_08255 [Gemmatimonadetes bacterium SCN 70-22]|nr:MAG: hypothetical protein ABS52_08255 [Gemmatimonadetes bacterium SCN 70-22]